MKKSVNRAEMQLHALIRSEATKASTKDFYSF